jgi:hypothetical protein
MSLNMGQKAETSANMKLNSSATTSINSKETKAETYKGPSFGIQFF